MILTKSIYKGPILLKYCTISNKDGTWIDMMWSSIMYSSAANAPRVSSDFTGLPILPLGRCRVLSESNLNTFVDSIHL